MIERLTNSPIPMPSIGFLMMFHGIITKPLAGD